jgi:hypothetical protein
MVRVCEELGVRSPPTTNVASGRLPRAREILRRAPSATHADGGHCATSLLGHQCWICRLLNEIPAGGFIGQIERRAAGAFWRAVEGRASVT